MKGVMEDSKSEIKSADFLCSLRSLSSEASMTQATPTEYSQRERQTATLSHLLRYCACWMVWVALHYYEPIAAIQYRVPT